MSALASRLVIIGAIVGKDLREFSRDRLWMVLTPLTLATVILLFWISPDRVDETLHVGLYPPSFARTVQLLSIGADEEHAIEVVPFDSEKRLAAAVSGELEGDGRSVAIGLAFPDDFLGSVRAGQSTTVTVYVDGAVPPTIRRAVSSAIREVAYGLQAALSGKHPANALPITLPDEREIVLGEDRAGAQVPLRDKLRPMMALIMLMMEALALAGLVAIELERRTITALLVTPARAADVLVAKGITGTILGLSQVLVFLAATQSLGDQWLLVTTLVVLGAAMMSAIGMLAGSAGKDFMGTLFTGVLFIIPLMIPAIAVLIPGSSAWWVRALPSYGLTESLVGVMGYGRGWSDVAAPLGTTIAWVVALFAVSVAVLERRVASS